MRRAAFTLLLAACALPVSAQPRVLDDFENLAVWHAQHTDDISAAMRSVDGKTGKALHLDFNFADARGNPINGYATAHRDLPLELPANYEISFWVRGVAPVNNLQFKLIDASGENVWWLNQPDFTFPQQWQQVRARKRQIEFAWGPTPDRELRHSAAIEFVVGCGRDGGHGFVEFDDLSIRELSPADDPPLPPTPNALMQDAARKAPRGAYPRAFVEQAYWTIVGVDGGAAPALISEDGAIEPRKGGWSIEPFLIVDGKRISWADASPTQSLLDGYLPLPSVEWKTPQLDLRIEAFARGARTAPQLVARYRLRNTSAAAIEATLQLAIRPFQVNPPMQFLNSPGGISAIRNLHWSGKQLDVDEAPVALSAAPQDFIRLNLDGSNVPAAAGSKAMRDDSGHLSGALVYKFQLPAGSAEEIDLAVPMRGAEAPSAIDRDSVERERDAVAGEWRVRLNRVVLKLPGQAQRIDDTLRTALAHMLISRDGAALRPGTRSYARSWIRDGAMIADALLRLGETDAARDYVDWYAPHQFGNGKVPCCVDHRGSDPVPENDSHGELIHAIAQVYRYTRDRDALEKHWPHVEAAIHYMDQLRASETGATNTAFKGLLPASISHEGYSAKPMHSYWDDFWALTGYKDAAALAQVLGKPDAARIAQARDAFANDLHASIAGATKAHAIDYLPGSVELGDFDATSTTIALAPAGERSALPPDLLRSTFDRYWENFLARRDGAKPWEDYTPYEWRVVGSLTRLGDRAHAQALVDFFFATGARPAAWNQWAEVVGRDPRKPRFVGDMPHAWVASDFVRSTLDLFAYERDDALVLAAGVPADWLEGAGIAIEHLRTPWGELSYRLRRTQGRLELKIDDGVKPPGGFVLPWALAGRPGATRINNAPAPWHDNELHIDSAPALITVDFAGTE